MDRVGVHGKGAYDFNDLCKFTYTYGYCPIGVCTCERIGPPHDKPKLTRSIGYPAEGKDADNLCQRNVPPVFI
jgi:hypothetical protein